jgi:hypothetical protein
MVLCVACYMSLMLSMVLALVLGGREKKKHQRKNERRPWTRSLVLRIACCL